MNVRTRILITILALFSFVGIGGMLVTAAPAPQPAASESVKIVGFDLNTYLTSSANYIGKRVSVFAKAMAANDGSSDQLSLYTAKDDSVVTITAKLRTGVQLKVAPGDTVVVTGIVSTASTAKKVFLTDTSGFRAFKLSGKVKDGSKGLANAAFFKLPYGSISEALPKGKSALIDLIKKGMVIGISNDQGDYQVIFPEGRTDILIVYGSKDPNSKSAIWAITQEFPNGSMGISLDTKDAISQW